MVRHEEEVDYLHRLQSLVPRAEELVGLDCEYDLRFCRLGPPFDRFYLIRDVSDSWHELSFECRQGTNVQGHQSVAWHSLEVFGLPQCGQDV